MKEQRISFLSNVKKQWSKISWLEHHDVLKQITAVFVISAISCGLIVAADQIAMYLMHFVVR